MLIFEKPISLIIDSFVVFTNMFYTREYIYVIGVNYKGEDNKPVRDAFNLTFEIDGAEQNFENLYYDSGSADRFNVFRIPYRSDNHIKKVTVIFEHKTYYFQLTVENFIDEERKRDISVMTLFKTDYEFIPSYIHHYKNIGIKDFSLYYNGKFENLFKIEKMRTIFENIVNERTITVRFIEWNFPYWYKPAGYVIHSISQITAITDMLYKSKYQSNYVLFNDLDEYIYFNKEDSDCHSIQELLQKYKDFDYLKFNMVWATYITKNTIKNETHNLEMVTYDDFNTNFDMKNFSILENCKTETWRTKCILKPTSVFYHTAHRPYNTYFLKNNTIVESIKDKLTYKQLDGFYHVMNIKEKLRTNILN